MKVGLTQIHINTVVIPKSPTFSVAAFLAKYVLAVPVPRSRYFFSYVPITGTTVF